MRVPFLRLASGQYDCLRTGLVVLRVKVSIHDMYVNLKIEGLH